MSNATYEQLKKRYQLLIDCAKESNVEAMRLLIAFRVAFHSLLEPKPVAPAEIIPLLSLDHVVLSDVATSRFPGLVERAHAWLNAHGVPSVYGGAVIDTDIGQVGDMRVPYDNAYKNIKGGPPIDFKEHTRLERRVAVAMQNPTLLDAFREQASWRAVLEITDTSVRVLQPNEISIRVSPAFYIIDEIHRNLDDIGIPPEFVSADADAPRAAGLDTLELSPTNVELADVYRALNRTRDFVTNGYKTTLGMLDELDARLCAALGSIESTKSNADTSRVIVRVVDSATGRSWFVERGEFFTGQRVTTSEDAAEFTRYLGEQIWPFTNSDGWVVLVNKCGEPGHSGVFMSGRADITEIAEITPVAEGTVGVRAYVYATDADNRVQWVGMQYGDDELSLNHDHRLATPFNVDSDAEYCDMAKSVLELNKVGLTFNYVFVNDWV